MRYLILLLLITIFQPSAFSATVDTARGPLEIEDGSTHEGISQFEGTVDGLKDVTFVHCNFSRSEPHTRVFENCANLTFIDCNLNNVELQADFVAVGSLTIHQKTELDPDGKIYHYIERPDDKTVKYEVVTTAFDTVKEEFPLLDPETQEAIRETLEEEKIVTTGNNTQEVQVSVTDTPADKQIKGEVLDSTFAFEEAQP